MDLRSTLRQEMIVVKVLETTFRFNSLADLIHWQNLLIGLITGRFDYW
jgi:hypothetical protein